MIRAPKGLEGVIVATTSLTKIDGQAGRLIYRGYDVTQLAGRVSYESVAHLLWYGHLPNRQELSTLETRFSREHVLPNQVVGFLKGESKVADPLSALQTSVSIVGIRAVRPMLESVSEGSFRLPSPPKIETDVCNAERGSATFDSPFRNPTT